MTKEELTKNNFAYTSLVAAIFSGHDGIASTILSKALLPVNTKGNTGNSPLLWASKWGQLSTFY
jgi:ankyrin repeat protein